MDNPQVTTDQQTVTIEIPTDAIPVTTNATEQAAKTQIETTSIPQEPVQPQSEAKTEEISTKPSQVKDVGGRPCEFCADAEQIMKKTNEYYGKHKNLLVKTPPYLQELAILLDCHLETLTNWKGKKKEDGTLEHPLFFEMIKKIENFQQLRLMQRTLGRFNPTGAIFLLKTKHGFIETEKQILAGQVNEPIDVRIIEDRRDE